MTAFVDRLRTGPTLLLDGGLGSLLIARGLEAGQPPEGWVLTHPDALLQAHAQYVAAGSEAVHACTFGAHRLRLGLFGLEGEVEAINRQAVALARQSGARWVLADVGPSGQYLPPVGSGQVESWRAAWTEQVQILAELDVDALHLETMTDAREALAALAVCRQVAPHLPVVASCTFDRKKRGFFTLMGDRVTPTVQALVAGGAAAVGANCSLISADMLDLAGELIEAADVPVIFQPNAGQPRVDPDGVHYDQDPEDFARDMAHLAMYGAAAVGGCCGTDPSFISALARALS